MDGKVKLSNSDLQTSNTPEMLSFGGTETISQNGVVSTDHGYMPRKMNSPTKTSSVLDSPTKSPMFLARQRLIRKYQRRHVSSPAERKLFARQVRGHSVKSPERLASYPKMPRLTQYHSDNGDVSASQGRNHDKTLLTDDHSKVEETEESLTLRLSDSSDNEDNAGMPHLHRVSSEEKTLDSPDGVSEQWFSSNQNSPVIVKGTASAPVKYHSSTVARDSAEAKHDTFKERESIFEVLQHEQEKETEQSSISQSECLVIKSKEKGEQVNFSPPRNGLVLNKNLLLKAPKLLVPFKDKTHRPGLFSMPDLLPKSGSDNSGDISPLHSQPDSPIFVKEIKVPVSDSVQESVVSKSLKPLKTDQESSTNSSLFTNFKNTSITSDNLRYGLPCCDTEKHTASIVSGAEGPNLTKSKPSLTDATSFISEFSDFKHEREDSAEVYPDSLSSLEDCPERSPNQSVVPISVGRQLSCPIVSYQGTPKPLNRRRHLTVSGNDEAIQARERVRRRRPKPVSSGCACCMDVGSGKRRKRRKRHFNGVHVGPSDWNIPHALSVEQEKFVHHLTLLVSLRHKVFRLCQVLFPKLSPMWQLNPDTEQVDILVGEITDVTRSLKSKAGSTSSRKTGAPMSEPDVISSPKAAADSKSTTGAPYLEPEQQSPSDIAQSKETSHPTDQTKTEACDDDVFLLCSDDKSDEVNKDGCENVISLSDSNKKCLLKDENDAGDSSKSVIQEEAFPQDSQNSQDLIAGHNVLPASSPTRCQSLAIDNNTKSVSCASVGATTLETIDEDAFEPPPVLSVKSPNTNNNNVSVSATGPSTSGMNVLGNSCKSDSSWESAFLSYLSERSPPMPQTAATESNDPSLSSESEDEIDLSEFQLVDMKVDVCRDPWLCLTKLRRKVICLLQPLLPNLTLENNFDKFSDDVDLLVELVTESNESKESRSSVPNNFISDSPLV